MVELKAKRKLSTLDKNQLGVYLNSAKRDLDMQDVKIGLLINFSYEEVEIEEKLDDEPEIALMES